jgi:hypothetical protein
MLSCNSTLYRVRQPSRCPRHTELCSLGRCKMRARPHPQNCPGCIC